MYTSSFKMDLVEIILSLHTFYPLILYFSEDGYQILGGESECLGIIL